MKLVKLTSLGIAGLIMAVAAPVTALADDHEEAPGNIATTWVMHVKSGHGSAFEDGMKAHIAAREEAEDPREWQVFSPVIGDDINHYIVRYCCFKYADEDAYVAWNRDGDANLGDHFNEHVDPHVKSYSHYLDELDFENSNWPEEDPGFRYFGVSSAEVKSGQYAAMTAARTKMSQTAKENDWPYHWSWGETVGGSGGITIVFPYMNYADMAPGEVSFYDFMVEHLGEEEAQETLSTYSGALENRDYTVYVRRDDLSMGGDDDE